jgi:hypothetical protein
MLHFSSKQRKIFVRPESFFLALLSLIVLLGMSLPSMAASTFRANSGGTTYTSSTTGTWNADSSFTGSSTTYSNANTIANTADPKLYQSERWGSSFGYSVPVANGSYTLNLYFAEIFYTSAGKRVFNVAAQGQTVLSNFDIVAAAGGANRAIVKSIPVTVTNGVLSVNFTSVVDNAKISAIEVTPATATPPAVTPVSVTLSPFATSAAVSGVIYQQATTSAPVNSVAFYLDNGLTNTEYTAPYYLGGTANGQPKGFNTANLSLGNHTLKAIATVGSTTYSSSTLSFTVVATSTGQSTSLYPIPFSSQYVGPSRAVTMTVDQVLTAIGVPGKSAATWSPETWSSSQAGDTFSRSMVSWYLANGIQPTISDADTRRVQQYSGVTYGPSLAPRDGIDKDAADNKLLPNESDWPHLRVPASYFVNNNPMPLPALQIVSGGEGGFWYHVGDDSQPLREVWNAPLCYGDGNQQFTSVYDANSSVSGVQPILSIRFTIPTNYQPVYRNSGDNPGIIAGRQADGRGAMTELYHASEGGGSFGGELGSCYNQGTNVYPYKLEGGSNAASKEKFAAKLITPLETAQVASGAIKYFDHPIGFAAWKIFQAVVPASQNRDSGMGKQVITDLGWLMYGSRVRLMLSDAEIDALTSNLMVRAIAKTFNRYGGVMMDGSGYNGQHVAMRASVQYSDLTPFGGGSVVNTELINLFNTPQVAQNWALVIPPMWPTRYNGTP